MRRLHESVVEGAPVFFAKPNQKARHNFLVQPPMICTTKKTLQVHSGVKIFADDHVRVTATLGAETFDQTYERQVNFRDINNIRQSEGNIEQLVVSTFTDDGRIVCTKVNIEHILPAQTITVVVCFPSARVGLVGKRNIHFASWNFDDLNVLDPDDSNGRQTMRRTQT
jgi:hypothetical protein